MNSNVPHLHIVEIINEFEIGKTLSKAIESVRLHMVEKHNIRILCFQDINKWCHQQRKLGNGIIHERFPRNNSQFSWFFCIRYLHRSMMKMVDGVLTALQQIKNKSLNSTFVKGNESIFDLALKDKTFGSWSSVTTNTWHSDLLDFKYASSNFENLEKKWVKFYYSNSNWMINEELTIWPQLQISLTSHSKE